jgi:hypothetical protein
MIMAVLLDTVSLNFLNKKINDDVQSGLLEHIKWWQILVQKFELELFNNSYIVVSPESQF